MSRLDPSGAIQIDAEHPSRNRKVVGSKSDLGLQNRRSEHVYSGRVARVAGPLIIPVRELGSRGGPVQLRHMVCRPNGMEVVGEGCWPWAVQWPIEPDPGG